MNPEKKIKILLVEDDSVDRELFVEALTDTGKGVSLEEAANGKEALDYLATCKDNFPDVIFMDLNMPIMDGREALQKIKGSTSLFSIPVFVLSTSNAGFDVNNSYKNGANLFMVKPHSYSKLVELLKSVIVVFENSSSGVVAS